METYLTLALQQDIVNLHKIKGYNSVNLKLGYQMIEIRSPKDLINYGND